MSRASRTVGESSSETAEPERKTSNVSADDLAEAQRAERIARRAYERFQTRGGQHGRDLEDWFEAERELLEREFRD
jgi:serine phosphatase RsbU (regulator of sigma subunit)